MLLVLFEMCVWGLRVTAGQPQRMPAPTHRCLVSVGGLALATALGRQGLVAASGNTMCVVQVQMQIHVQMHEQMCVCVCVYCYWKVDGAHSEKAKQKTQGQHSCWSFVSMSCFELNFHGYVWKT